MTPRLSVVVPFYNVRDYIGDCLDSIARQTWTDFEAILVDDGSPDDSVAIASHAATLGLLDPDALAEVRAGS